VNWGWGCTARTRTERGRSSERLADADVELVVAAAPGEVDAHAQVVFRSRHPADADARGRQGFALAREIGDATTLDFVIRQRNRDRWNYLVGFNWELSRAWSLQAEIGFGGSRDNAIVSGTYRW